MHVFNCDDVATLLTKEKAEFFRQLYPNWQYTVRTGSRDIWLAIITITIIFALLFLSVLFYYLVCFRCLYDEIKVYNTFDGHPLRGCWAWCIDKKWRKEKKVHG